MLGGQGVGIGKGGVQPPLDLTLGVASGPVQHTLAVADLVWVGGPDLKIHKDGLVAVQIGQSQLKWIGPVEGILLAQNHIRREIETADEAVGIVVDHEDIRLARAPAVDAVARGALLPIQNAVAVGVRVERDRCSAARLLW